MPELRPAPKPGLSNPQRHIQKPSLIIADGELSALRSAKAFLQAKSGGLEKELHVMRKQTESLELKHATACQELEAAAQRAKDAEARRAELLKLVEEVRSFVLDVLE